MKLYPAWEWRNPSITEWQPEEDDDPEEEAIARRRAEHEAKQPKTIKQQMEAKKVQCLAQKSEENQYPVGNFICVTAPRTARHRQARGIGKLPPVTQCSR